MSDVELATQDQIDEIWSELFDIRNTLEDITEALERLEQTLGQSR